MLCPSGCDELGRAWPCGNLTGNQGTGGCEGLSTLPRKSQELHRLHRLHRRGLSRFFRSATMDGVLRHCEQGTHFRVGCFIDWVLCHPGTVMVTSRRIFIVSASSGTDCPSRPCPCFQSVLLGQRSSILLRICSALVMASVMPHSRAGHGLSPTSPVFPDSIEETPRSRWYFMLLFAVRTDHDVAALESTLDVLRMDYHVHPASTSQVVKNEFIFHNVAPLDPGQLVAHAACPMSSTPHPQKRGTVGQERKPAPKVPQTLGPWDSNVGQFQ